MATGTFYLRPSADISLGHPVYPDTLGAGYLAINEEVSDDSSTYIGVYQVTTDSAYTSVFKLSLNEIPEIINILSATFIFNGYVKGYEVEGNNTNAYCYCTVKINEQQIFTGYTTAGQHNEDSLTDADMPDLVSVLNNHIKNSGIENIPDVTIEISTEVENAGSGKQAASSYVSQIAIALECEYAEGLNINHKVNGEWKAATAAYQKQNGAWIEITEDECKSILSGSFITK